MSKSEYTSIGVKTETKDSLDSIVFKLQAKQGKKLTYDEVIRQLIRRK